MTKQASWQSRIVRINIETLHLHGYTTAQQQRFLRALETQFAQHAATQARWSTSRHIDQLAPLHLRANTTPEHAAALLAQQLFELCARHDTENPHG